MAFSKGQLAFALFFIIAFIILMIFSYTKDKQKSGAYFKGTFIVLFSIIIIYALFWFYVRLLY